MTTHHSDFFLKFKPLPLTNCCSLCHPQFDHEQGSRICADCTQTLLRISPVEWSKIHHYSQEQGFSDWFIEFSAKRMQLTVKAARKKAGVSQKVLADDLGVTPITVKRWEAADKLASKEVLVACRLSPATKAVLPAHTENGKTVWYEHEIEELGSSLASIINTAIKDGEITYRKRYQK